MRRVVVLFGVVIVAIAFYGQLNSRPGSQSANQPIQPVTQPGGAEAAMAQIRTLNEDVGEVVIYDNLLMIRVGGDWNDAGATIFACEDVLPVLRAHGVGDLMFAVYNRFGKVISTGSRCP